MISTFGGVRIEYILLIFVALLWSGVGVLAKTASVMVSSNIISLCRFGFGVVFLLIFIFASGKKPQLRFYSVWFFIGAFGKSINYIFENIGIVMGVSYGNIVVFSMQAIFAYIASIFIFKEKPDLQKCIALLLCISGVIIVSTRGMNAEDFLTSGAVPLILFMIGALGSAFHLISQKKLVDKADKHNLDPYSLNLSTFFIATFITAAPIPFTPGSLDIGVGGFDIKALLALLGLGFITGLSFTFYARAIRKVPFFAANIITNLSVVFTVLWGWIFFGEKIGFTVILGAVLMLSGIVLINVNLRRKNYYK